MCLLMQFVFVRVALLHATVERTIVKYTLYFV